MFQYKTSSTRFNLNSYYLALNSLNSWLDNTVLTDAVSTQQSSDGSVLLQNNASKLLLAIMESRHDSENAEKILYKMRPNELVSVVSCLS